MRGTEIKAVQVMSKMNQITNAGTLKLQHASAQLQTQGIIGAGANTGTKAVRRRFAERSRQSSVRSILQTCGTESPGTGNRDDRRSPEGLEPGGFKSQGKRRKRRGYHRRERGFYCKCSTQRRSDNDVGNRDEGKYFYKY